MSRSKLKRKWMRKGYAPRNHPSRYIITHTSADVSWLQESGSFGGHSIPKGGHRMVCGLVRASVKEEVKKQIEEELEL